MFRAHKKVPRPRKSLTGVHAPVSTARAAGCLSGNSCANASAAAAEVKQRWLLWKSKVFCRFLAWQIDLPEISQFLTVGSVMHKNDSARRPRGRHAGRTRRLLVRRPAIEKGDQNLRWSDWFLRLGSIAEI